MYFIQINTNKFEANTYYNTTQSCSSSTMAIVSYYNLNVCFFPHFYNGCVHLINDDIMHLLFFYACVLWKHVKAYMLM